MRFISLKSVICNGFALSVNSDLLKDNKIAFLTPAGIVLGTPEPKEIHMNEITLLSYRALLDGAVDVFEKELERSGDNQAPHDGYILLKDVEIRPYGQGEVVKLEALVLFTGDISGVFLTSVQPVQQVAQD